MRNITSSVDSPYIPRAVLVAYQKGDGCCFHLESREVLEDGTVGAAKGVSREFLHKMVRTFGDVEFATPHGPLPKNLLYADPRPESRVFVWWNPPRRRTLTFTSAVRLEDGEYSMPGVIYMARDTNLWVYAFKGARPSPKARLLMGPFFNYYEDCKMCLGNSRRVFPKNGTWEEHLLAWENIFWNSANAHLISHPVKGDLCAVLRKAVKGPFDVSVCRTAKLTLPDLLNRLK